MSDRKLSFQTLKDNDFDFVYEVYFDETVNPFLTYDQMSKSEFQEVFKDLKSRHHSFLLLVDSVPCGFITVIANKGRSAHTAMIATYGIRKDFQGKGLGKKFLKKLIDDLKHEGFLRIQLTVEADNDRAIKLYQSLGFEVEGRMKNWFKRASENEYKDELMMAICFPVN
ncbi:MAG: GNAT family N-acetyltransferase [Candidatus Caenarcaniphilales bacterium]|nr:GNAT family N-acetyltransferase [Candidatus Caenarcaniphilales bacterium]